MSRSKVVQENIDCVGAEDVYTSIKSLDVLPDKSEWKTTTSKFFKVCLAQFLSKREKFKWIEIGAAQGHTTLFLSPLANRIVSIDFDEKNCQMIRSLEKDNVEVMCIDLYHENFSEYMKKSNFDAALIDAVHTEKNVQIDIQNCLSAGVKIFVFDDYGAFSGVKVAVDKLIESLEEEKKLRDVRYIGMPPMSYFPNTQFKVLQDWEGVIVEVRNEE